VLLFTIASGKLTGAASPTIQLIKTLNSMNVPVKLLCYEGSLMKEAQRKGVSARKLSISSLIVEGEKASVIVASRSKDHLMALAIFGCKKPIYRLWYKKDPPMGFGVKFIAKMTTQFLCPYPGVGKLLPGAVDSESFFPLCKLSAKSQLKINGLVVGMVSRLKRKRGHEKMLEAAYRCPVSFNLLFVGDGEEKKNIIKISESFGLREKTFIISDRSQGLNKLFSSMDILAYLSIGSEATARTVLEAMAAELPVIATLEGGVPFILGEWNKKYFEGETLDKFLAFCLMDPSSRKKIGRLNLLRARKFNPLSQAKRFIKILSIEHEI